MVEQSAFSSAAATSFRSLSSWLRSHVSMNPFGISACIQQGRGHSGQAMASLALRERWALEGALPPSPKVSDPRFGRHST